MSFLRSPSSARSFNVPAFVAAGLVGVLLATTAGAARQAAPKLSGQHARVAQGVRVDLAASSLPAAELARLRPDFEKLKPRARTNAE